MCERYDMSLAIENAEATQPKLAAKGADQSNDGANPALESPVVCREELEMTSAAILARLIPIHI